MNKKEAKIERDAATPLGTGNDTYPARFSVYYPSPLADPKVYQAVYQREMRSQNIATVEQGKGKRKRKWLIIKSDWGQPRIRGLCLRCRQHPTGLPRAGYCVACQEHIGKVWRGRGRVKYGRNHLGGVTAPVVGPRRVEVENGPN